MPLYVAIRQVFTLYRPGGCHVKNLGCGIVKSLSEASVQNANNGPSTQLIEATSCIDRSNAMMKAEELCQLSSFQTLTTDKKTLKLPITKEACRKVGGHDRQLKVPANSDLAATHHTACKQCILNA